MTNPAGDLVIFFKFSFIKIYLRFNTSPELLKKLQQNLFGGLVKIKNGDLTAAPAVFPAGGLIFISHF